MDDLLQQFIVEARELVQQVTDDLLALERDPGGSVHLDSAFRAVHTLKGSVGLFDFAPVGLALHAAEDLLSALRSKQGRIDSDAVDTLLNGIALSERWVDAIEQTGQLPSDAPEEGYRLARALRSHLDERVQDEVPAIPESDKAWIEELLAGSPDSTALQERNVPLVAVRYTPRADCFFAGDDPLALLRSVPDLVAVRLSNREPWPPSAEIDPFSCNLRLEALSCAGLDAVKAVFRFVPDQVVIHEVSRSEGSKAPFSLGDSGGAHHGGGPSEGTGRRVLRVDAARIDHLADLVGEMVVVKNTLGHLASQAATGMDRKDLVQGLLAGQAVLERLVSGMHAAVMDVRMMPMRDIFRRFPRAVRDIAGQLGKTIDFSMEGEDVEADKAVVEGLFEPLLHVLRNAVAHGAEAEPVRRAAGKPLRTRVVLRARRDGDRVVVEVEDDGRGIDPAVIRRSAQARGLVSDSRIERMSDDEAMELIFAPGFSTASEVTDLSGRGVGMDAVRTAVERLGGQIGVQSVPGHGTTVHMDLPLTVVMTKIMAVRAGGELYGIPIDGLRETALVPCSRILPVQGAEAFVLRDRTLPLIWLADLLDIPRAAYPESAVKVLVISVDGEPVGLAVDGFGARMDVLMRPMAGILAEMPGVMGTTLLGDGSVLMILDVPELIG